MAAATNVWVPGFSESPAGQPLVAQTIIEMLNLVGDEIVPPPAGAGGGPSGDAPSGARPLMSRRELLARVLWTRAILDADNASTKLIIEYLDGKPGEAEVAPGAAPVFCADDMALAETVLREGLGNDDPDRI